MLFKYCTLDRGFKILEEHKIRLTQPSDFNDPFELHPEFQLMSRDDITALPLALDSMGDSIPGQRQVTAEVMERMVEMVLPYSTKMAQQHSGETFIIENNAIGREYYNQKFGILSLTETHDNLLMWAHYADNHKGVVIGFDETHPFFVGSELVSGLSSLNKVEYNAKRPVLSISTKDTPQVFLRKSPEWSYEREWRLIRPLVEATEIVVRDGLSPIHMYDIPTDVIKILITGSQMEESEYHKICNYSISVPELRHIKIHRIQLSKESYLLETFPPLSEVGSQELVGGRVMTAKPFEI